jgi:hypothetical protein
MNLINNKKFVLFVLASLALFVLYLLVVFRLTNTASQNMSQNSPFEKITPGNTKEETVVENLGKPEYADTKLNNNGSYYQSAEKYVFNDVYSKGSVVVATKEIEPSPYPVRDFGNPDFKLYNDYSSNLFWYIYLSRGVALQVGDGLVYAQVKFKPQDKNNFISKIAPLFNMTLTSRNNSETESVQ